jgi:branched-chain amino acid transport system ATP-binding protein
MADPILQVDQLMRHYGGVRAVNGVTFSVKRGAITGLIGPNGAGKTTTLNLISGYVAPSYGDVFLAGNTVTGLRPDVICRRGVARTFQKPQTFPSLTVAQNVLAGATTRGHLGLFETALRLPSVRRIERQLNEEIDGILDMVGIADIRGILVSKLPFGQLRLTELARALASKPMLILMDEPASGLSGPEIENFRSLLQATCDLGISILIVEHNMPFLMSTADEVIVLDKGLLLASGTPREIQDNVEVQRAYLGSG